MPEREFELYLSLLSRFLRLQPAQRDEVADELRDHLDQRLEELAARGLSREEAIHKALEEFGDAAELAKHFTQAAHVRRRRLIMRYTYGTIAALAASLLIATAFWPASPVGPSVPRALAQAPAAPGPAARPAPPPSVEETRNLELETKLDKPIEIAFMETSIEDCLTYIRDFAELSDSFIIDRVAIKNRLGSDPGLDSPVTLNLAGIRTRTALELVLEMNDLGYTIRDGIVLITTADKALEIRVYNVRDLVAGGQGAPGRAPDMQSAMMGMLGAGGGPGMPEAGTLAHVISRSIAPESWFVGSEGGPFGTGSIVEYNGLLVVKNSQAVHGRIRKLLDMMRQSIQNVPGADSKAIPDGTLRPERNPPPGRNQVSAAF